MMIGSKASYRFLGAGVRLLLLAALVIPLGTAHGADASITFTVNSTIDAVDTNPGDGLCATAAGKCTLRAAIQETNALPGADTISLPPGTYTLTIPGANEDAAATGDLDITDDLIIDGAGHMRPLIDANRLDRAFHIPGVAVVTMWGVTIGRGSADSGGGIYNSGSLTLRGSRLYGNVATGGDGFGGGGIYNTGPLTISYSTLSGNSANDGGGIYNYNTGALMVTHSTLSGNSGGGIFSFTFNSDGALTVSHSTLSGNSGGGIQNANYYGTALVTHSTLSGNSAEGNGGGIWNSDGRLIVSHSTLSGNSADLGGGIYNEYFGTVTVANSTLSGNLASEGGGIYNTGYEGLATVRVTQSTLSSNSAGQNGGGLYSDYGATTLEGSILGGNTASQGGPDCAGTTVGSAGYNLVGNDGGCDFIAATGDLIGTPGDPIDPLLGPLQDNGGRTATHALLTGSPAIDTGTPDNCPPTDQRGVARPMDGNGDGSAICDIGAFELEEAP